MLERVRNIRTEVGFQVYTMSQDWVLPLQIDRISLIFSQTFVFRQCFMTTLINHRSVSQRWCLKYTSEFDFEATKTQTARISGRVESRPGPENYIGQWMCSSPRECGQPFPSLMLCCHYLITKSHKKYTKTCLMSTGKPMTHRNIVYPHLVYRQFSNYQLCENY